MFKNENVNIDQIEDHNNTQNIKKILENMSNENKKELLQTILNNNDEFIDITINQLLKKIAFYRVDIKGVNLDSSKV